MFTVYVLKSGEGLYKGVTNDVKRRIAEHNRGKTITTRKAKNWELAYSENYDNFEEARKRELYFKTAAGRRFIKTKLSKKTVELAG